MTAPLRAGDHVTHPVRLFLTGGEGIGWALDENLALTHRMMAPLADIVTIASLASADVVHSEDPIILSARRDDELAGKRILCQMDSDVYRLMERPDFARPRQIVGLWLATNLTDERRLKMSGLRAAWVPQALDTTFFRPDAATPTEIVALKSKWGIPADRFLIGNFMRDSLGTDLAKPKPEKSPELFLAIMRGLHACGLAVHAVLAGPRRHWLRARLTEEGLPFTFIGESTPGDDLDRNVLDKPALSLLYHTIDLYLVTSRWEAGSRVVLEASASRRPILSTHVGHSPDILEPASLFRTPDEAIAAIATHIKSRTLDATLNAQYERVMVNNTLEANTARYREIFQRISEIDPYEPPHGAAARPRGAIRAFFSRALRSASARTGVSRSTSKQRIRISLWHEFQKPPYGGGNQFMLALRGSLEALGADVSVNQTGRSVDVHICNSLWFDIDTLVAESRRRPIRMLHRIDGPIALIRGADRAEDDRIFETNSRLASATVLQSAWSYERLCGLGYRPVGPFIVRNSVDQRVFNRDNRPPFDRARKVRLIASSWSDNPRKGGSMYKQLEDLLDWERYEFTFVGRAQEKFSRIRHVAAVGSPELAALLRQHDIYITCSQNDPCSNALIEALACGLPAVYLNQGGHPELVDTAGLGFEQIAEVPELLKKVVSDYEMFAGLIKIDDIATVARKYLDIATGILGGGGRVESSAALHSPGPQMSNL